MPFEADHLLVAILVDWEIGDKASEPTCLTLHLPGPPNTPTPPGGSHYLISAPTGVPIYMRATDSKYRAHKRQVHPDYGWQDRLVRILLQLFNLQYEIDPERKPFPIEYYPCGKLRLHFDVDFLLVHDTRRFKYFNNRLHHLARTTYAGMYPTAVITSYN